MSVAVASMSLRQMQEWCAAAESCITPAGEPALRHRVSTEVWSFAACVEEVRRIVDTMRWSLTEEEVVDGSQILAKLQSSAPEIEGLAAGVGIVLQGRPSDSLSAIAQEKGLLDELGFVYRHTRESTGQSTHMLLRRMYPRLLHRSYMISNGFSYVQFTRRRFCNDRLLGKGSDMKVSLAQRVGSTAYFASGGSIDFANRIAFDALAKGVQGVLPIVDHAEYSAKDGRSKSRILYPYCNVGDLQRVVLKALQSNETLSRQDVRAIVEGLVGVVARLHNLGIYHRDIKPPNVLLHRPSSGVAVEVYITDFDAAVGADHQPIEFEERTTSVVASPEYAQAYLAQDIFTDFERLDSWSLGMTLYFVLRMGPLYNELCHLPNDKARLTSIAQLTCLDFPPEPASNTPQHLVWELLVNRITARDAATRLCQIEWS